MMDKRTVIAFILIGVIFFLWSFFNSPKPVPNAKQADSTTHAQHQDTTNVPLPQQQQPAQTRTELPPAYAPYADAPHRYITIESPLYQAKINTHGGLLSRLELKKYNSWEGDRRKVQLINDSVGYPGELGINFTTRDGKRVSTRDLNFQIDGPETISLSEKDSVVVTAVLNLSSGAVSDSTSPDSTIAPRNRAIIKRYVFHGDSYGIGVTVTMDNMAEDIGGGAYELDWKNGLMYQEYNSVDESSNAKSVVSVNHELTEVDATDVEKPAQQSFTGPIDWIGIKTKYFATALIPSAPIPQSAATVTGAARPVGSNGRLEHYGFTYKVPYTASTESHSFTLFVGPLEYDVAKVFGLQGMLDFGWKFIVRPISEFFMLPIFRAIHTVIPNYGIVIIVFSLLIRGLLWPFSVPQIKSSRKMQLLQPKIAEIREKFTDDPQRQQMETMNVYREYGVNPVSGCLPMVFQMPILYALWATLHSSIELRQAGFALWIHDLSVPDAVVHLPFSLPLLGDTLSGLALIMGAVLFVQQKMMITDPKQKMMVYFMPVFLTVMFNHLPSGLNLYYLMFNLLAIGQQVYLTKFSKSTVTLDDMKRDASQKKKGWLSQKMAEAQKMAQMQQQMGGTSGTAGRKVEGRTPVEPKKNKKA
jgi:YidC/Oxa1 family membrane protein insertase